MGLSMINTGESLSPTAIAPTITKSLDPDTRYMCFLNTGWNGRLIVYAQATTDPPLPQNVQQDLLSHGYAIAVAHYRQKTDASHDRPYHTQNIKDFFTKRCGRPCQVYEITGGLEDLPSEHGDNSPVEPFQAPVGRKAGKECGTDQEREAEG